MKYLWRRFVALTVGLGLTTVALAADVPGSPPPPPRWGVAATQHSGYTPQSPYAQQPPPPAWHSQPTWQPVAYNQPTPYRPAVTLDRPVPLADDVPLPEPLPNALHDASLQPARFTPPVDPMAGRPPLLRPESATPTPNMFGWKQIPTSADTKQPTETGPMPKVEALPNPPTTVAPTPLPMSGGIATPPFSTAPYQPVPYQPAPYQPAPIIGSGPSIGPGPMIAGPAPGYTVGQPVSPSCPAGGCPGVAPPSSYGMMPVQCGTPAMPSCVDGSDPCYTPWSTFYVGSEYLMWWTRGVKIPPLVTTGPTGTRVPGGLGQPGTVILDGNDYVLDDMRWGLRFNTGMWFDESRCFGVDGNFFFLGEKSQSSSFSSLGDPELARPLIFNLADGTRVEGTQITASPGIASGRVDIAHQTQLWGAEANFRTNLFCTPGCFVDLLVGWRTLSLDDQTAITEFVSGTRNGITGNFLLSDLFQSENTFNGGQIGLAAEHRLWNRWTIDWKAKIAMGSTNQRVDIAGATRISGTNTAADGLYGVGVLALPPNIGSRSRNVFSIVPEVQVNLGYQINPYVRTYVGYNFMYWSNVARAGEAINRNINPNFLAPPIAGGPNEPSFNWKGSGFWAQGVNFGLEFRW